MSMLMRRNGKGNGSALINRIQDEFEDAVQRLYGSFAEPTSATAIWAPNIDVEETDAAVLVKADLPGVDAKDVEVTVQNGAVVLRGQKNESREEKGTNYARVERFSGSFYRSIPLPAEADESRVSATSSKGVVTVTIPKKPGTPSKRIPVQSKD